MLCVDEGTAAERLPSPNGFLHLVPSISFHFAAAQKEVPRNLRDPEPGVRLGERKRENTQPNASLPLAEASTAAEERGSPRGPRGEQPGPARRLPLPGAGGPSGGE